MNRIHIYCSSVDGAILSQMSEVRSPRVITTCKSEDLTDFYLYK